MLLIHEEWRVARHYSPPFFKYSLKLSPIIKEVSIFSSSTNIFAYASVAPVLSPADSYTSTWALNYLLYLSAGNVSYLRHRMRFRSASTNSIMECLLPSFWRVIFCINCNNPSPFCSYWTISQPSITDSLYLML